MNMIDMGHKMGKDMITPEGKSEDKIVYPTLHIDKIPEDLKDKDVGHTCRLEIVGKIVSKSESDNGESMAIEIHKLGYIAKTGSKTFEEYDKSSKGEKEAHDKETAGVNEREE